jgi:23S rRNA (adenine1618-N6)-methyltransferase
MDIKKKVHPTEKSNMHPRNQHRGRYDFQKLIISCPELAPFVSLNAYDDYSIDFFNPDAVKMLNKALLVHYYGVSTWDIPADYLCPPIPGRADYIHHIADVLGESNQGKIPKGKKIKCLDIGVGANCIYPIIGVHEYQWSFIGSDIDPAAVTAANKIISSNPILQKKIIIRLQPDAKNIFPGIILDDERIDVSICNPPFHASLAEAQAGSRRKLNNLTRGKMNKPALNFGGQHNELVCEGGEKLFVHEMVRQSKLFSHSCFWFSTLISKQDNLNSVYAELKKAQAVSVKSIQMSQGNKISRLVAWTFLSEEQQKVWIKARWKT